MSSRASRLDDILTDFAAHEFDEFHHIENERLDINQAKRQIIDFLVELVYRQDPTYRFPNTVRILERIKNL